MKMESAITVTQQTKKTRHKTKFKIKEFIDQDGKKKETK